MVIAVVPLRVGVRVEVGFKVGVLVGVGSGVTGGVRPWMAFVSVVENGIRVGTGAGFGLFVVKVGVEVGVMAPRVGVIAGPGLGMG